MTSVTTIGVSVFLYLAIGFYLGLLSRGHIRLSWMLFWPVLAALHGIRVVIAELAEEQADLRGK